MLIESKLKIRVSASDYSSSEHRKILCISIKKNLIKKNYKTLKKHTHTDQCAT